MGSGTLDVPAADDDLIMLTRDSRDGYLKVDGFRASPASDVIEVLTVRTGPDAGPTELRYDADRPGYYDGTGRLFIDHPVRRADVAVYRVGDLRRVGVIAGR